MNAKNLNVKNWNLISNDADVVRFSLLWVIFPRFQATGLEALVGQLSWTYASRSVCIKTLKDGDVQAWYNPSSISALPFIGTCPNISILHENDCLWKHGS